MRLCGDDFSRAFEKVEAQLGVLVMRAQVMLSLSGIVITVTGFSGQAIAHTGAVARACIVAGVSVVLLAAAVAFRGVLKLRWLTQTIDSDELGTLRRGLALRDEKAKWLGIALTLFVLGFALYVAAIAQLLALA